MLEELQFLNSSSILPRSAFESKAREKTSSRKLGWVSGTGVVVVILELT